MTDERLTSEIYLKWNYRNITHDWVDKNICIFENWKNIISLAWNI